METVCCRHELHSSGAQEAVTSRCEVSGIQQVGPWPRTCWQIFVVVCGCVACLPVPAKQNNHRRIQMNGIESLAPGGYRGLNKMKPILEEMHNQMILDGRFNGGVAGVRRSCGSHSKGNKGLYRSLMARRIFRNRVTVLRLKDTRRATRARTETSRQIASSSLALTVLGC